ncbi:hypothetical protein [Sphingomonas rubra]|nr:hypothetical protein [Sphingomonas rubra]
MASTAIRIDLGDMADHALQHLATGEYESMDEVMQDAVRALDRERAESEEMFENLAFQEMLRQKVEEAFANPAPSLPIDQAFVEIRRRAADRRARAAQG